MLHPGVGRGAQLGFLARALRGQAGRGRRRGLRTRLAAARTEAVPVGLPGSAGGSRGPASGRWKLLSAAHAATSMPSSVKCSSEPRLSPRACATTARKHSPASSCSKSRARLRQKVQWSKRLLGRQLPDTSGTKSCSRVVRPTAARCAPLCKALSQHPFNRRAGGSDGRPTAQDLASNPGESSLRAAAAKALRRRRRGPGGIPLLPIEHYQHRPLPLIRTPPPPLPPPLGLLPSTSSTLMKFRPLSPLSSVLGHKYGE